LTKKKVGIARKKKVGERKVRVVKEQDIASQIVVEAA